MTQKNEKPATLSSVDFLGLASLRKVEGITIQIGDQQRTIYVQELSEAEKVEVFARLQGKARLLKGGATEIDLNQLTQGGSGKILLYSLVTDETGKTTMFDEWRTQGLSKVQILEKLGQLPNSVVDQIVKVIRRISGLDDDSENPPKGEVSPN